MRKFEKFVAVVFTLAMLTTAAMAQYAAPPTITGAISTTAPITAAAGTHLQLNNSVTNSDQAGFTVRVNSVTNTGTANSWIGYQSKPGQGTSMANNVIGAEISPRLNDAIALTGSGSIIGLHADAYLKGTTGNVAGDVRGQQIELVTDDAGTRTISGDVVGTRYRMAFSGTITGAVVPFRVEVAEAQTNSKQWTALMKLTGAPALVWNDAPGTEPTTADGYIKVIVNGAVRYIQLYSGAPVD
jgi:hypothetical protein